MPTSNLVASEPRRSAAAPAALNASLGYLARGSPPPHCYAYDPPPGTPIEGAAWAPVEVALRDGRAAPAAALEREGFELRDAPTAVTDFTDRAAIERVYYPEASALALAITGGTRAFVFDHLVRRREADRAPLSFGRRSPDGVPTVNGRVHNDYTEASGQRRLDLVLPDPGDRASVRRYCILNVWRSIRGPVVDTPLAVCDARTVSPDDLVAGEVRYPRRTGEIYFVTWASAHAWTYYPRMDRHEALVFKQYDSQLVGAPRFTPHAAFELPDVAPDAPRRESIEVRCLVVFDAERASR